MWNRNDCRLCKFKYSLGLLRLAAALLPTLESLPELAFQHCNMDKPAQIIGIAVSTQDQVLYCEQVSAPNKENFHIDYLNNKKNFAIKDLDFTQSLEKPNLVQKDFRSGETRIAQTDASGINFSYQEQRNASIDHAKLSVNQVDVIDAGFDHFIRRRWEMLHHEKIVSFSFGSIAHLKNLSLRIHREDLNHCKNYSRKENSDTCFLVDIDNIFLRAFFKKMQLIYDNQHRLKHYSGPVNLNNEKGQAQIAEIDYFYAENFRAQNP